jgi:hypothetical protein
MTILQAIDARSSRRTYVPEPIEPDKIAALTALIDEINREARLCIRLIDDGSAVFQGFTKSFGHFSGVRSIVLLAGKTGTDALFEILGYYGETLVLQATAMGLGTCWVGGTFDRSSPILALPPDETLACVITVGHVAKRKKIMERIIFAVAHILRMAPTVRELCESDQDPPPEWFRAGVMAAIKAPTARNRHHLRFRLHKGEVTVWSEFDDPAASLEIGIARAHFDIASGHRSTGMTL